LGAEAFKRTPVLYPGQSITHQRAPTCTDHLFIRWLLARDKLCALCARALGIRTSHTGDFELGVTVAIRSNRLMLPALSAKGEPSRHGQDGTSTRSYSGHHEREGGHLLLHQCYTSSMRTLADCPVASPDFGQLQTSIAPLPATNSSQGLSCRN
jgi:hypothetical protein